MSGDKKVPEIRFKGFVGKWAECELKSLCDSFSYGLNASAIKFDGVNKYLRITDIDDKSRRFDYAALTSPDVDLSKSDGYLLKNGDILFARTGASVGKTYLYNEQDGKVYFAGFLIRASVNNKASPQFIFQNTQTKEYGKFVAATSQRSGQPGINAKEYSEYRLFSPEEKEQTQIGNYLQKLDSLINQHQQKHDKLSNIKKAMLEKMFPKQGETIPEIRFKGFSREWDRLTLGKLGSVAMNKRIFKHETSIAGEVPFFKIGTFGGEPDAFISKLLFDDYKAKYPYPKTGDLLLSASGSIGRIVEYKGEEQYFQDSNIVWLKHDGKINNSFLKVFYSIVRWSGLEGSTIKRLYNKNILDTEILLPEREEQAKLGNYFQKLDTLINQHQQQITKLNNIKQACLSKMFV